MSTPWITVVGLAVHMLENDEPACGEAPAAQPLRHLGDGGAVVGQGNDAIVGCDERLDQA